MKYSVDEWLIMHFEIKESAGQPKPYLLPFVRKIQFYFCTSQFSASRYKLEWLFTTPKNMIFGDQNLICYQKYCQRCSKNVRPQNRFFYCNSCCNVFHAWKPHMKQTILRPDPKNSCVAILVGLGARKNLCTDFFEHLLNTIMFSAQSNSRTNNGKIKRTNCFESARQQLGFNQLC